jgi:ABC-type Mn2+/Zn2+ transport system permease subunit
MMIAWALVDEPRVLLFDEPTSGIDVGGQETIYTLLHKALTVALGVRIMGGLMTAALVAIPASTARNMSKTLTEYAYGGFFLGCLATVLGIEGFKVTGFPAGPLIVIAGSFFFLLSLGVKRRGLP